MSHSSKQKKQVVPSTIKLKAKRNVTTLTQMVTPTPKKLQRTENNGRSYMVSRKATTFHSTKMQRIVKNGQPTMTQTFKTAPQAFTVKEEPFVFTQLSCEYPTSPSASVIDLLSHASDAASELSEDLLPEGMLTQAIGSPVANLGPYSSNISHSEFESPKKKDTLTTSMVSNTFEYGLDWNDANPGDLVMASASDIGHPAFKAGIVGCSYVMLGYVVEFVYVSWNTGMKDENWDGIVDQHERLRVRWLDVGAKSDEDWEVTPAVTQWLKVIAKKVDGKLSGINDFMKVEIRDNFFHTNNKGWCTIKRE